MVQNLYSFSAQSLPGPPLFRTPSQTQDDCSCERKAPKRGSSANDIEIKEKVILEKESHGWYLSPISGARFRPVSQSNIPSLSATLHT